MLNINELCQKLRYDVLEAMCYLGFEYDDNAVMPDILIVEDNALDGFIHSTNHDEPVVAGYDCVNNKIYIPIDLLNNPERLYQALCHELTHSWQGSNRLLLDLAMPNYYFRQTEMEAFMVGSYMEATMFYRKTLSTLTFDKVMANMSDAWNKLQVKSLLNQKES